MLKNQGPSKTYSHQCGLVRSVADFTSCWSIGWTWLNGIGNPDVTGRLVISKGPRILTKAVDGSCPWMSGEPNLKEHTLGACWNGPTRKISWFQLIMFHPPENASNVYIYSTFMCKVFWMSYQWCCPVVWLLSGCPRGTSAWMKALKFKIERRRFWTMPKRVSQSQSEQISCFDLYRDPAGGWRDCMPCSGSVQRRRYGACGPEGPIGSWISWESFLAAAWKSGADCLVW